MPAETFFGAVPNRGERSGNIQVLAGLGDSFRGACVFSEMIGAEFCFEVVDSVVARVLVFVVNVEAVGDWAVHRCPDSAMEILDETSAGDLDATSKVNAHGAVFMFWVASVFSVIERDGF